MKADLFEMLRERLDKQAKMTTIEEVAPTVGRGIENIILM